MNTDSLRQHLVATIRGGIAYETFQEIISEFKHDQRGLVPERAQHSPWQIIEHCRITLRDILDYSQNENGDYKERKWPDEYWPREKLGNWDETVQRFESDRKELEKLVLDLEGDLLRPFSWAPDHTLLREVLLACDHLAYHLGELVELKRWIDS